MSANPVHSVIAPVSTTEKPAKPKAFSTNGQSLKAWTGQEKARLKKLEGIVQRGMSTFIEVGNALTEIRRDKLYRLSPFGGQGATFEEYAFNKVWILTSACKSLHQGRPSSGHFVCNWRQNPRREQASKRSSGARTSQAS